MPSKRIFLMIGFACFLTVKVFPSSGSAIIPSFELYKSSTSTQILQLYLSNITEAEITVYVKLIDGGDGSGSAEVFLDGDDDKSTGTIRGYGYIFSYDENPSSGESVEIVLTPFETVRLAFQSVTNDSTSIFGFGNIEWTSAADESVAMIAHARWQHNHSASTHAAIQINDGDPF